MKRILAKKHKIGTYEIDKISLLCFDDKRFVLNDEIQMLSYFHKDSVINCKKDLKRLWWLKNIVIIEKDCNNWKTLWWLKKIVMIKKYWDNLKILGWFKKILIKKNFSDEINSVVI